MWELIHSLLVSDLCFVYERQPLLEWPCLRKTLNDFKEGRTPSLLQPCPELLDALHHVLRALKHSCPDVCSIPIDLVFI